jgi:hypothetical protein
MAALLTFVPVFLLAGLALACVDYLCSRRLGARHHRACQPSCEARIARLEAALLRPCGAR